MSLINIRNLGVTRSVPLFSALNLTINAGDRLGIVAANGRGKSTLLKLIAGMDEPTSGDIVRARGLTTGYVEQHLPDALRNLTFHEAVSGALSAEQADTESWRIDIVLDDLGIDETMRRRRLDALSGGWQRLAILARILISEPDVLLLDEPTNHLDLAGITRLERWLASLWRDIPVIIASHDRAFLDAVTNRTLFLRTEQSSCYALPYSRARVALDETDASDGRRYERDMKAAKQLRRQAAKLNNIGINSGSDLLVVKTKQLRERADKLEASVRPAHRERSAGAIRLGSQETHAKMLVALDDAVVAAPDGTQLFRTGKQFICQGDRIVLLGRNGAGKTRLVALLKEAIENPPSGVAGVKVTPSLVLGYGDQSLADLDDRQTPLAVLSHRFELSEQRARMLLAGAGIGIDMQGKVLGLLSGGQKTRLGMLVLRLENPSFYLLDEPTNHLDIEGQEALEAELLKHQASCLLVSHDRSFVRNVGNRFWQIDRSRLIEVENPEAFFASFDAI